MKHIKNYKSDIQLKKYTCIKYSNENNNSTVYYIDEIIKIKKYIVYFTILYHYKDIKVFKETEKYEKIETSMDIHKYIEDVLYTSDNLNDCKKFLEIYTTTNKFNL